MSTPNGVYCCRGIREQARAGQDPSIVGVEDAVVDAHREAEVIRIDDEASSHGYFPLIS